MVKLFVVKPVSLMKQQTMPRKKWTAQTDETDALLKSREKRKWQIAFRRYVVEGNLSVNYAPYFGLDVKTIRNWFELQFTGDMDWANFGTHWQFEHLVPVIYFDFSNEEDLHLCWNFVNILAVPSKTTKEGSVKGDLYLAYQHLERLHQSSGYPVCKSLLAKIEAIQQSEQINIDRLTDFLQSNNDYLTLLQGFSSYEFELLNSGRDVESVKREAEMIRNLGR